MDCVLGIDGGGTRTRCAVFGRDGRVLARSESGPSNHLLVGADTFRRSIEEAACGALCRAGIEPAAAFVSAGLAGIDFDGRGAGAMRPLFERLGFRDLLLNGDMVIAHAGALGGSSGVVALSGTGSVVLGVDPCGGRVKVGGWGPLFGDEGSAFRIGKCALRAAAHAVDGRGPRTSLVDAVVDFWRLAEFRDTVERAYVERIEAREIAALAPVVAAAAETGDNVARAILRRSGAEIGEAVLAAIRRLNFDSSPVAVSWQGSLLESCAPVRYALSEALRQTSHATELAAPLRSPLEGAFRLGAQALGWELPCTKKRT